MTPHKVRRDHLHRLTDLPNVGPATAADLQALGFTEPAQLAGQCAYAMYERLCQATGQRHDPCVIDVFLSITHFLQGDEPRPWWDYTRERQEAMARRL